MSKLFRRESKPIVPQDKPLYPEELVATLDSLPFHVVLLDRELTITLLNRSARDFLEEHEELFEKHFQTVPATLPGTRICDLPIDRARAEAALLDPAGHPGEYLYRIGPFTLNLTFNHISTPEGEIQGYLLCFEPAALASSARPARHDSLWKEGVGRLARWVDTARTVLADTPDRIRRLMNLAEHQDTTSTRPDLNAAEQEAEAAARSLQHQMDQLRSLRRSVGVFDSLAQGLTAPDPAPPIDFGQHYEGSSRVLADLAAGFRALYDLRDKVRLLALLARDRINKNPRADSLAYLLASELRNLDQGMQDFPEDLPRKLSLLQEESGRAADSSRSLAERLELARETGREIRSRLERQDGEWQALLESLQETARTVDRFRQRVQDVAADMNLAVENSRELPDRVRELTAHMDAIQALLDGIDLRELKALVGPRIRMDA